MSSHAFIRRDEVLFLLLWSSGYIGAKFGLPHAGNYTLLFLRYVLCVEVAAFVVSIRGTGSAPISAPLSPAFWRILSGWTLFLRRLNLAFGQVLRPFLQRCSLC